MKVTNQSDAANGTFYYKCVRTNSNERCIPQSKIVTFIIRVSLIYVLV